MGEGVSMHTFEQNFLKVLFKQLSSLKIYSMVDMVAPVFLPFGFLLLTLCLKLFTSFFITTQISPSISHLGVHPETGQLMAVR